MYYNNTPAYARTCRLGITVEDEQGRPCEKAGVAVEILNMAEYYPAAVLTADGQGRAEITVGMGTVRVRAWKDDRFAEALAVLPEEKEIRLVPEFSAEEKEWAADIWEQEEWTPLRSIPCIPEGSLRNRSREGNGGSPKPEQKREPFFGLL